MGGRVVSGPAWQAGTDAFQLLVFDRGLCHTHHRSLLPVTVLFVMFDVGGWMCKFPLFVRRP